MKKKNISTEKIVLLAMLTAIVGVLGYFGSFIKIGGLASITLTLVPIVIGAALCGAFSGAWLGAVWAIFTFISGEAAFWLTLSIPGTIITIFVKCIAAGLAAGLVYRLFEHKNRYFAVFASAVTAPVVNTAIFFLGCILFFYDGVTEMASAGGKNFAEMLFIGFAGLNFVFELVLNMILSPAIVRIISIKKK